MDINNLTVLNARENDTFLELQLISQKKFDEVVLLVRAGYYLSQDVLTAMVVLGPSGTQKIDDLLNAVHEGRYSDLTSWLRTYYGEQWKDRVGKYQLITIARNHLSSEECAKYQLWDALKYTNKADAMETLAKNKGIQYIKDYFKQLKTRTCKLHIDEEEQDRVITCLLKYKEHEILAKYGCWPALSQTLDGCSYVALKQDYKMLFSFLHWNEGNYFWDDQRAYCLGVLKRAFASLNKDQQKELKKYLKRYKADD